jgi:hypothetical protein
MVGTYDGQENIILDERIFITFKRYIEYERCLYTVILQRVVHFTGQTL